MKTSYESINALSATNGEVLEIHHRNSSEVSIVFKPNIKILITKDVYLRHYFYVGKVFSRKEIEEIKKELRLQDLYKYGLMLLKRGAYSSFEIHERLLAKSGNNYNDADAALKLLIENNLINDRLFAENFLDSKANSPSYGNERIKDELLNFKHLDSGIVESLVFPSENERAEALMKRFLRQNNDSYQEKKRKLWELLNKYGYEKGTIASLIESLNFDDEEENENRKKALEKALRLYASRYEEKELKRRCYNYLLQKGYNLEGFETLYRGFKNDEKN